MKFILKTHSIISTSTRRTNRGGTRNGNFSWHLAAHVHYQELCRRSEICRSYEFFS